jgi:glycosyltransferase involved in cell wall biosynthesis
VAPASSRPKNIGDSSNLRSRSIPSETGQGVHAILTDHHKKLRLGFVSIEDASDIRAWSGTPFHILSQLRRHNVEVELFSPLDRRLKYVLAPTKLVACAARRSFILGHAPLMLSSYARQIERRLRAHPVDVLFSTSSIPITHLRCAQPIVFWTDAVFHSMPGYYGGSFAGLTPSSIRRGRRQEQTALQRCSAAIYSSHWAADIARTLTDPQKIHVIPFGSSIPATSTPEEIALRAREKRATRPHTCELLFVGVDWDRKGGDIAIDTARLLNQSGIKTTLRVVGSRPSAPPPDFVELLGFLDKSTPQGMQQLTRLFQNADFLLLPTKAEASAIVFCEACSFGLPTITCATGGVSDYIHHGVYGACLPLTATAADFASEIRTLLAQPARYEAFSSAASLASRDRLNWNTSIHALVDLCRSLAG